MELSKLKSLEQWLESTTRKQTASGFNTEVVIVNDGEQIKVLESGGQNTGSGGYSAAGYYAGNVTHVNSLPSKEDSCTWKYFGMYRMHAPSIIHVSASDTIGGVRNWRTTYLCATQTQIDTAVINIERQRQIDVDKGDLKSVQDSVVENLIAEAEHERAYHYNGCCHYGIDAADMHARFCTDIEKQAAMKGIVDERALASCSQDYQNAIRKLAGLPERERRSYWSMWCNLANASMEDEGRKFAQAQLQEVVNEHKLHFRQVKTVMRICGPSLLVECFEAATAVIAKKLEPEHRTSLVGALYKIRRNYKQGSRDWQIVNKAIRQLTKASSVAGAFGIICTVIGTTDFDNRPVISGLFRVIGLDYWRDTCGELVAFITGVEKAIEILSA